MFKEKFIEKLKLAKTILTSKAIGIPIALILISSIALDNPFLGLKILGSSYSTMTVDYDANNKFNTELTTENLKGISFDEYTKHSKNGNSKNTHLYISKINNNNNIEIAEIGKYIDIFTERLSLSNEYSKESEDSFLSSLPFLSQLSSPFGGTTKKMLDTHNIKDIINIDMDKNKPTVTFYDNEGVLHLKTISRYEILDDAETIFLTDKQMKDFISKNEVTEEEIKKMTKDGIQYNGRLESRFGGNIQKMLLPDDFKEIISISMNSKTNKIFSYVSKDGSLKTKLINDINFNTDYQIVDENNHNIFSDDTKIIDNKSININIVNKLVDDENSKINVLKLNVDRKDIKKIINIDKALNSFMITYLTNEGEVYVQELGMTFGVIESRILIEGVKVVDTSTKNIERNNRDIELG